MLLSKRVRFIYLHLPRTAGFSIEAALPEWSDVDGKMVFNGHATAYLLNQLILEWPSFFSFAFVRNPWDYWVSMYEHVLTIGPQHPEWGLLSRFQTFGEYLRQYVFERSQRTYYLNQIDYLNNQ